MFLLVLAVVANPFAAYRFDQITSDLSQPPSIEHPMGTDAIGHDLFALVLRGAKTSIQIGVVVALASTAIGVALGALAAYRQGWVDQILARLTDLALTIPELVVLLVLANRLRQFRGNWILIALTISAFSWPGIARVTRGSFRSLVESGFVEAARASGASGWRIVVRHLLPNAAGTVIVCATLAMVGGMLAEAALGFLGFGVTPPDVSLGKLVELGQGASTTRPWLFYFPGATLLLICLCVHAVGEGLRRVLDPFTDQRRRGRPPPVDRSAAVPTTGE